MQQNGSLRNGTGVVANCCRLWGLVNKPMKFAVSAPRLGLLPFIGAMMLVACSASAQLGAYHIGDIVTNFTLPNRYLWTNDHSGQIFTPGNTSWQLRDFSGKIVFFEVFAVW
jgi:hypothetical protein